MDATEILLRTHRAHDVRELHARWLRLARKLGLHWRIVAKSDRLPVPALEFPGRDRKGRALYFSAGIHGDEPGATEGLLRWAGQDGGMRDLQRRGIPFLILPCLNPWGLRNNRRENAGGGDLNRLFQRGDLSPVREVRALVEGRSFSAAFMLHEDYDALGTYLYEVVPPGESGWGERMLAAAGRLIPPDPRPTIERRRARGGLIRRYLNDAALQRFRRSCPEALYLSFQGITRRSITIETPSEDSLPRRAAAHAAALAEAVALTLEE